MNDENPPTLRARCRVVKIRCRRLRGKNRDVAVPGKSRIGHSGDHQNKNQRARNPEPHSLRCYTSPLKVSNVSIHSWDAIAQEERLLQASGKVAIPDIQEVLVKSIVKGESGAASSRSKSAE